MFATDDKGNIDKDKSITVQKGVLNDLKGGLVAGGDNGTLINYNYIEVGADQAKGLFEFIATNSNVEWANLGFSNGGNVLSTSHLHGGEAGNGDLLTSSTSKFRGMELDSHTHSHPDGITYPSGRVPEGSNQDNGGDIKAAKIINSMYTGHTVHYSIFTPSDGQYTPYSAETYQPDLPMIIIGGSKQN